MLDTLSPTTSSNTPSDPTLLVGLSLHRNTLEGALDRALGGRTTRIAICGPVGAGRTTLLDEARALATARGMNVLATQGRDGDADLEYAPLLTLLDPIGDQVQALPAVEAAALGAAVDLRAHDVDDRAGRTGMWRLLSDVSAESPVLIALDDTDQMDAATMSLLAFAIGRLDAQPVAVVMAADCHRSPNVLVGTADDVMVVGGVDRDALARSVEANEPATDWVLAHVASFAGDDPGVATELVRSLTADQRAGRSACPQVPVAPESFVATLAPTLDHLSPAAHRALVIIAADSTANLDVVRKAESATGQTGGIAELEAAGYIEILGTAIRTRQPMLDVVAYQRHAPSERRSAHLALAAAMTDERHRSGRAWQLAAGTEGPDESVARALAGVGEDHYERWSFRSAAVAFERAAGFAAHVAERASHTRTALGLWTAMADLTAVRGVLSQPFDESVECHIARSAAIRWLDGDAASVAELRAAALVATSAERPRIDALYADAALASGHVKEAVQIARSVRESADPSPAVNLAEAIMVLAGMGSSQLLTPLAETTPGDIVGGRASLRHAQAHARFGDIPAAELALNHHARAGQVMWDPAERTATYARLLATSGRPAAAARLASGAIDRLPPGAEIPRAVLREVLAECQFLVGDREAAMAILADVAPVFAEAGMARFEASTRRTVGRVAWSVGQTDVAANCFKHMHGLDATAAAGELVVLLAATGRATEAKAWLARIDTYSNLTGGPRDISLARAAVSDSTNDFDRAIDAARESKLVLDVGELLTAKAEWLLGNRRDGEATQLAAEALAVMIPSGISAWLGRLEQIAPPQAAQTVVPDVLSDLTAAERRVALAVSRGLTNKEAAAELFVSVKTVDSHLQRIYPKLFIRSRSELAALVNSAVASV